MIFSAIAGLIGFGVTALQVATFTISVAYQAYRQNKLKSEMDKRKQVEVPVDGQPFNLGIPYGRNKIAGGISLKKVRSSYTYAAASGSGNVQIFDEGNKLASSRSGRKNEYLLMQQAICYAGINRIVDVEVDNKAWNDTSLQLGQRMHVYRDGGVADPMATANGVLSTNLFTNAAYASMVFRLNRDDYNYNGAPAVSFYIEGMKVKTIQFSGGVYSMSSTKTYSNNPARVLVDYLTNPVYGLGLPVGVLDLATFYNAQQVCARTVRTGVAVDGKVFGRRPDVENQDGSITTQPAASPRDLPLYECNAVLDSERSIRENIELVLESMNEAELVWSGGVYKLLVDYPTNITEQDLLVKMTLNPQDIIRESISLTWPDSSNRYNQVVARFRNEHENFSDDTATWPTTYSAVHLAYLTEDSNQPLKTEVYLPCTTDPYHALAKAEQIVRLSRRSLVVGMKIGKKGILLEPGDIVKINEPTSGLVNETMKITSVKLNGDLTADIECVQYNFGTFAWNVSDDIAYSPKLDLYQEVVPPATVRFAPNTNTGLFGATSGLLTWTAPDDISVNEYFIEISEDAGATWKTLATVATNIFDVIGLNSGVYKFSVRSKSSFGRLSARVIALDNTASTDSFTIQRATSDKVAVIYANNGIVATNTQSYTLTSQTYVAYYVYSGDPPTLPIRSGITFSQFVGDVGINSATVTLYAVNTSSSTPPSAFSGTFTYTFTTGALTGGTLNGWSKTPPTVPVGSFLWYSQATASANTATDTISTAEFSTAAVLSGTGASGTNGIDGLNSFIVTLYKKNTSSTVAPTEALSGTFTYTFSTGILSGGTLNTWSTTQPGLSTGEYLWVRQATASSNTNTDTIGFAEFTSAVCASGVGTNGADATSYWLTSSLGAVSRTSGVFSPTTVLFSGLSKTGVSAVAAYTGRFIVATSTDGTTYTTRYTSAADESSYTYTLLAGIKYVRARLYLAGGTTVLLDEYVVPVIDTGANGITLVLSNTMAVLPSDDLGVVSSYANSGSTLIVYEGTTALTASASLTVSAFRIGTPVLAPAASITVGAGSYASNTATIANHSAMSNSVDQVNITYPVTVYRADGTNAVYNVVQVITKQKLGGRGAGWWRYDAGSTDLSGVVHATPATQTTNVNVYWNALHTPDIAAVAKDKFVIATTHVSGTKAFEYDGTNWILATTFIDGNLMVAGTVTADKMNVSSISAISAVLGTFKSATTGERIEIETDSIKVYDAANVLRLVIGDLTGT